MPHVIYDVNAMHDIYNQEGHGYYLEQPRFQRGFGPQRGRGVLGAVQKVWHHGIRPMLIKYVAPLAREALQALGQEGVEAGQRVLTGISKGENLRESVTSAGTQAAKNIMKRAGARLQQEGSGKRKPRSRSTLRLVGQSVLSSSADKRGRRKQNLGLY